MVETRWRSPYTSSMRLTAGQNLDWRTHAAGKAACGATTQWLTVRPNAKPKSSVSSTLPERQ